MCFGEWSEGRGEKVAATVSLKDVAGSVQNIDRDRKCARVRRCFRGGDADVKSWQSYLQTKAAFLTRRIKYQYPGMDWMHCRVIELFTVQTAFEGRRR